MVLAALCGWPSGSMAAIHEFKFLVMSPDGTDRSGRDVHATGKREQAARPHRDSCDKGGRVRGQLDPCVSCVYSSLAWSADGAELAFLAADAETASVKIELARVGKDGAAAAVTTLSTFTGIAGSLSWSPQGNALALLATPEAKKLAGALEAGAPAETNAGFSRFIQVFDVEGWPTVRRGAGGRSNFDHRL